MASTADADHHSQPEVLASATHEPVMTTTTSDHPRDNGIACALFAEATGCPLAKCPYMHVNAQSRKPLRPEVCNFYLKYRCLRDNCPYFHLPQAELDKLVAAGVTEYCPLDGMPRRNPLLPIPEDEVNLAAGEITGARPKGSTEPRPDDAHPTYTLSKRAQKKEVVPTAASRTAEQNHRRPPSVLPLPPYPFHLMHQHHQHHHMAHFGVQGPPMSSMPFMSAQPVFLPPQPMVYPPQMHQVGVGASPSYIPMQGPDGQIVYATIVSAPSMQQPQQPMMIPGSQFAPMPFHPMLAPPGGSLFMNQGNGQRPQMLAMPQQPFFPAPQHHQQQLAAMPSSAAGATSGDAPPLPLEG